MGRPAGEDRIEIREGLYIYVRESPVWQVYFKLKGSNKTVRRSLAIVACLAATSGCQTANSQARIREAPTVVRQEPSCPLPIASDFGVYSGVTSGTRPSPHDGIDLLVPTGTPVRAMAPGVVIHVGANSLAGTTLRISHGKDKSGQYILSNYAHLDAISIPEGAIVERGQVIAYSGSTGHGSGGVPHLHFHIYISKTGDFQITDSGLLKGRYIPQNPHQYFLKPEGTEATRNGPLKQYDPLRNYGDIATANPKAMGFKGFTSPILCK